MKHQLIVLMIKNSVHANKSNYKVQNRKILVENELFTFSKIGAI